MSLAESVNKFYHKYVLAESETRGRVDIVTDYGRVHFTAELRTPEDYNRAIDLLIEERGILFPEYDEETLHYA